MIVAFVYALATELMYKYNREFSKQTIGFLQYSMQQLDHRVEDKSDQEYLDLKQDIEKYMDVEINQETKQKESKDVPLEPDESEFEKKDMTEELDSLIQRITAMLKKTYEEKEEVSHNVNITMSDNSMIDTKDEKKQTLPR